MDTLDITVEDPRWGTLDFGALCTRAILATLQDRGIDPETAEVSVLACDDARIAVLNADFRGKAVPTNVLSWPGEELGAAEPGGTPDTPQTGPDGLIALGDIAIAYDTCARESVAAEKPLADHATHLIVHGTLHLLGYDHETEPDAAVMEGLERKILGNLGLNDPYKDSAAT